MISYIVENSQGEVLGYSLKLTEAKEILEKSTDQGRVTKLIGPYRYEGFHARILEFRSGRYREVKS